MNYKIKDFLNEINENCSNISYLSVYHILNKLYKDVENIEVSKKELLKIIEDYPLVLRYLNDFAGTIYRKHNTSVPIIYNELCSYFNLDTDNKFTYEHTIKKLSKQTPVLIMSLTDEDIKLQTVENFCEKLDKIKNSTYYNNNKIKLIKDIEELQKNITFVKKALQI
jgi:hypothetical protein